MAKKTGKGKVELEINGVVPPASVPLTFALLWPRLHWELTSRVLGDNVTPRVPSAISIFPQDGGWKVCLKERNQGLVGFLWGASVQEALDKAERALEDMSWDWRKDRYAPNLPPGLAPAP